VSFFAWADEITEWELENLITLEYMNRSLTNIRPLDDTIGKIEELRVNAKDYAAAIFEYVPESPERTLACRALEESVMWAVKAMCIHEVPTE
jgi:hypothetical protein